LSRRIARKSELDNFLSRSAAMAELSLKDLVKEVVEAVEGCPEPLQLRAFELLLEYRLGTVGPKTDPAGNVEQVTPPLADPEDKEPDTPADDDIEPKDLHAKTRKFLQDHGRTVEDINALYYKEAGAIKPLYDDLKSTGMSESQIRLSLLEALENALGTGEFEFNGESVREKTKAYKCYDGPNFTRNFRNNAKLFEGFDKYEPGQPIRLSTEGKAELARVIGELA
jgi:hypothetical protein